MKNIIIISLISLSILSSCSSENNENSPINKVNPRESSQKIEIKTNIPGWIIPNSSWTITSNPSQYDQ
jgi:hypothetical protein